MKITPKSTEIALADKNYTCGAPSNHSEKKTGKPTHFFVGLHNRKAFVSCKHNRKAFVSCKLGPLTINDTD